MRLKYLVCDANSVQYFEQSPTEPLPIMGIVDLGEPEKCAFALPLHGTNFLNPRPVTAK